ncbi:hypothetical protein RJ639_001619 [Escallonia herrerae]|uniref:Heat shock protein 70 n=1 Tax=Escallonia herrerae TaxID=1293975 RepID=A0AA89BTF5_9ASTE|nr:hypothetical protein RJ639_001619 [Escallonia herrerae]
MKNNSKEQQQPGMDSNNSLDKTEEAQKVLVRLDFQFADYPLTLIFLPESIPTAASLAYGFERKNNETILVFDLGGGTFDVSVLEVGDGVFEVLSTSRDTHLGGDDFDKRIVDWLAASFKKDEGIDL